MINNMRFKIIAEKLTKFRNFTRFLPGNTKDDGTVMRNEN